MCLLLLLASRNVVILHSTLDSINRHVVFLNSELLIHRVLIDLDPSHLLDHRDEVVLNSAPLVVDRDEVILDSTLLGINRDVVVLDRGVALVVNGALGVYRNVVILDLWLWKVSGDKSNEIGRRGIIVLTLGAGVAKELAQSAAKVNGVRYFMADIFCFSCVIV